MPLEKWCLDIHFTKGEGAAIDRPLLMVYFFKNGQTLGLNSLQLIRLLLEESGNC